MRIAVYGLWHLGCVTAACLAAANHVVVGLDLMHVWLRICNRGKHRCTNRVSLL